jgi:hypothetical protein
MRAPAPAIFYLLPMTEPIIFEEETTLADDSFVRELEFIMTPSESISPLSATSTAVGWGDESARFEHSPAAGRGMFEHSPAAGRGMFEYSPAAGRGMFESSPVPCGSRPLSPVINFMDPVPTYFPSAGASSSVPIPTNGNHQWKWRLDQLAQHRRSPGSVAGLFHPYKYDKLPKGLKPEDVFKHDDQMFCTKCGKLLITHTPTRACNTEKIQLAYLIKRYISPSEIGDFWSDETFAHTKTQFGTTQDQRQELFRAARKYPAKFPDVKPDYTPKNLAICKNTTCVSRIDDALFCTLCAYDAKQCGQKGRTCPRIRAGAGAGAGAAQP